ncbi:hypothetical protein N7499_006098 [Penicillium canescens]|nr:hypothetical protein N7499_006098 [Penicillium canescens]
MLLDLQPHSVIAVGVLLPALASIAVGSRFYSRRKLGVSLKEDDWMVLVSMVLVWGLGITNISGAALGALGAHSEPAGPNAPHHNTIMRGPRDEIVEQCHVRNWSLQYFAWSHRRHCIQAEISWSGYAITDVVTDILLLLFPVPLVWQLQLTIFKKISVLLVFLLGSLSTAIGITRMVVLLYFTYGTSDGYRDLLDTISTALIWSLTEASVAIIASCLPSIRPLVHRSSASECIMFQNFPSTSSARLWSSGSSTSPSPRAPTVATMAAVSAAGIPANSTVYVKNLDERIKLEQLKEALEEIFSEYGTILEIIAKRNLKAKGQAFVVFDNVDSATRAIEEINGFDIFDKPMVLDYAKTRSDATVQREGGSEELEAHKRRRMAEKERKQAQEALEAQKKLKRPAAAAESTRPAKTTKGAGLKPTSGATTAVVPDEYLPPNKILFLRELPDEASEEGLSAVFGRFEGFQEVRLVPGRKGIAFVEYEAEAGAISAKEATSGMPMGEQGKPIRVTYQRQ